MKINNRIGGEYECSESKEGLAKKDNESKNSSHTIIREPGRSYIA